MILISIYIASVIITAIYMFIIEPAKSSYKAQCLDKVDYSESIFWIICPILNTILSCILITLLIKNIFKRKNK